MTKSTDKRPVLDAGFLVLNPLATIVTRGRNVGALHRQVKESGQVPGSMMSDVFEME